MCFAVKIFVCLSGTAFTLLSKILGFIGLISFFDQHTKIPTTHRSVKGLALLVL